LKDLDNRAKLSPANTGHISAEDEKMNRTLALLIIAAAAAVAVGPAFAQQARPYNQIMKDVGATFANLKKNLDENSAAAAAQDAAKLEGLFTETEAWWSRLETQDAANLAKRARTDAAAAGAAAKGNDIKAAQASYSAIQKSCGSCHFAHREDTGKGFLIKP
jgi:cytochrome c556